MRSRPAIFDVVVLVRPRLHTELEVRDGVPIDKKHVGDRGDGLK